MLNDVLISVEYATGYVKDDWDDRMRILVNLSSTGTLFGQAWTKSAFGVTLLRLSSSRLRWVLWFCILTMNFYMFAKVILQWGKLCGSTKYDVWYRLDFCVTDDVRDHIKQGGNGELSRVLSSSLWVRSGSWVSTDSVSYTVYNLLMDFVFAIFPWLITWKLPMNRHEKISLCVTLSLGIM